MNRLQRLLSEQEYIVLDGAMGTQLFSAGLEQGAAPEAWNTEFPGRVRAIHRRYIEAGSQLILTNTFGGTSYRMKLHDLQDRVYELNRSAAELAREEADNASRPVIVAGSIGPSGELLAPMGTMTYEEAKAAFAEQARGLADGGVDVLWIETLSDLNEVTAAIEGARSVCDLPIAATLSFDTNARTMMGVTPVQAVTELKKWDLIAIGANCGANLPDTESAIAAMHAADPNVTLISKANAGIPRWEGSTLAYDGTPPVMAGYARRVRQAGARLIGACCGSTPAHIQYMTRALADPTMMTAPIPGMQKLVATKKEKPGRTRERRRKRRT